MTRQLLGGAAVAALIIVSATGARANPLNTFSNDNTTTINSGAAASTGDGGDGGNAGGFGANGGDANGGTPGKPYGQDALWNGGGSDPGTGGAGGTGGSGGTAGAGGAGGGTATATSESYNTEQEGVSNQTLTGSVSGNSVYAYWDGGNGNLESGGAQVGGFDNAAGINIASASSGHQSLNQQAVSLGIVGTVNLNGTGGTGQ
jgi:hypothetical protein